MMNISTTLFRSIPLALIAGIALLPRIGAAQTCSILSTYISNLDTGLTSSVSGQVDIFYVNPSENLVRTHGDPRNLSTFIGENLGGVARSEPAAVSWGAGHSAVFVRGSNGALWYLQWDNGSATGWTSLGGQITWNPYAVSMGPGHIIAFYRGTNKELWYREYSGGAWGPHTSLGGVLTSSPIAVSWGPGHMAVFTRGQANDLWYRERIGSTWGAWRGLGGSFAVDPVVVSRGAGLLDVFVRWSDSRITKLTYNGTSWGQWYDLGAPPSGAVREPAAAATGSGELIVFARGGSWGPDYRPIWRNSSFDGGMTWSGWIGLDAPYANPSANNPEAVANAYGGWTMAATNFPSGAQTGQLRVCSTPAS